MWDAIRDIVHFFQGNGGGGEPNYLHPWEHTTYIPWKERVTELKGWIVMIHYRGVWGGNPPSPSFILHELYNNVL